MTLHTTRRCALALTAGGLIAALRAQSPSGTAGGPHTQEAFVIAAFHRLALGDARVTVVSEGQVAFPARPTYAPEQAETEVHAAMRARFLEPPEYRLDADALLIETAGRTVLVDAGWGAFAPEVGRLPADLRAVGIDPASIDTVVLTHIHPDHVGGLRDAGSAPVHPDAEVVVAGAELVQWRAEPDFGAMEVDDGFRPVFAAAAEGVLALGERLRFTAPGAEVAPGVALLPAPGHTRGHAALRMTSGAASLPCAADAVHDPAFDVAHAAWRTAFDRNPARAEASRRALLEEAATGRGLVFAHHMRFPGLGHVERTGEGYARTPMRTDPNG